jgi:hypothetical protein
MRRVLSVSAELELPAGALVLDEFMEFGQKIGRRAMRCAEQWLRERVVEEGAQAFLRDIVTRDAFCKAQMAKKGRPVRAAR